jgi:hypothetical protein
MLKRAAIGAILVVIFALVFAPAGLSRLVLEHVDGITLLEPAGTLWSGQGSVSVNGVPLGVLRWDMQAVTVLSGALGYDFALSGEDLELHGEVRAGLNQVFAVAATGRVGESFVNQLMAPYDMSISGDLALDATQFEITGDIPQSANGQVTWDGGLVEFTLSGRKSAAELPAMIATLGPGPSAVVHEWVGNEDQGLPLMLAELQANGFAKVSMTRYFTELLNNPWPGAATADQVVLQVEEKVF